MAAHAPVLADDDSGEGGWSGWSLVEQDYPSVWQRLTDARPTWPLFLGLGALLGVVGTYVVSRVVKRRTRGLGASEIAMLADHREALLHSIREGVVAVGTDGRVTMVNDAALAAARRSRPTRSARRWTSSGLDPQVVSLLDGVGRGRRGRRGGGRATACWSSTGAPPRAAAEGSARVTTMRDRTELVSLQNQLVVQPLDHRHAARPDPRVQQPAPHHLRASSSSGSTTRCARWSARYPSAGRDGGLRDQPGSTTSAVAALVLAKSSVAAERGVRLELTEDSGAAPRCAPADSADLTTVLGNLVDNAVDACSGGPTPR